MDLTHQMDAEAITSKPLSVEDLIPHRGRMKLIERVLWSGETNACCATKVCNTWPLIENESVSSLVSVELIAQTCGAITAWGARDVSSDLAYMVGIKIARFHVPMFNFGEELTIHVDCPHLMNNNGVRYGLFLGRVYIGENIAAEADLQIVNSYQTCPESRT